MTARTKSSLLHLGFSLVLCLIVILFFQFTSYSYPLSLAVNFWQIALIFCVVNLLIGPFLAFLVYKEGKKSLKFDLSVIILFQAIAFFYGTYSLFEARPAWIVYSVDRFELVKNTDIYIKDISKVKSKYRQAPWFGPEFTAVQLSVDEKQRGQDVFNAVFANLTLSKQPEKYISLQSVQSSIKLKMQNLKQLNQYNSVQTVKNILSQYPEATAFVPLKADKKDMVVLLNKQGGVIEIVNLRPWK
ncbi:TfpX/TfpZ family type IV pilin accessory protein [Acinetobacter sp. YH16055]|uniref:TfpX/TfpZ family type IV pilin accessory protein n=1 Tax=Acinetobacter sp. YH16055 TaxID=2601193 RepID=UPI0015D35D73|nr:TfpX/TfpZ family type IV pilin accessory protein [Acinetobacter sp. YH16055]